MTRILLSLLALSGIVFAQSSEFEVASIKPSAPVVDRVNVGVHVDGAQVRCTYLSLKDYIRMAYNVKDHQIVGPDWLGSDRFDIAAKVPEGGRDKIREMLQSLLKDRFHMKFHSDSKEFPVYALVVGKGGPKMKESPLDPEEAATRRRPRRRQRDRQRRSRRRSRQHGTRLVFQLRGQQTRR